MSTRRNTVIPTVLDQRAGSFALARMVRCKCFWAQDAGHVNRRNMNAFESSLGNAMLDTDSIEHTCNIGL